MNPADGIPEYFAGKSLFITGGNGFMGKVLIEKLLRSLRDIGQIYILIRAKSNKNGKDRIRELTSSLLFENLRQINSTSLSEKLIPVEGNLTDDRLGLNEETYNEIVENVNIVVHLAASIRFNDPLSYALQVNVLGTKRVIKLAENIKNLEAFVHVSTAYAHCRNKEIQEIYYKPSINSDRLIHIMDKTDNAAFEILSAKILDDVPNTYAFSKSLAEDVVWNHRKKLPVIIMRPSIVVSCYDEPLPGWTDSLFGVVGIVFGAANGVIRVVQTDPKAHAAYIPVDVAAKAMISAIWYRSKFKESKDEDHIYNATVDQTMTNKEILDSSMEYVRRNPLNGAMWDISVCQTTSWLVFLMIFYTKQLVPALLVDFWLRLIGKQPRLCKIQKRYYKGMRLIGWFLIRTWKFHIDNFTRLDNSILSKDRREFAPNIGDLDPQKFMISALDAGRVYLLKEPPGKPLHSWFRAKIFSLLDKIISGVQIGLIGWLVFSLIFKIKWLPFPEE